MPVSIEDKIKAVETYINSFSKQDVEAIVGLYADDATIEDPVGTPLKEGIEAIREFYTGAVGNGAKLELEGTPRCAGDSVAFPFRAIVDLGGNKAHIEIIDTFRFNDDGKVAEMRAFWGPENMKPV
ncbi:nuclear transport factor 2 family protein [Parasphingorhabdus halotolerans]|uniref:SnoaL-like domain-containing protein n=1 Tax=Parasphingorhabdus halotolerans TaxID=2725558 RepID=A0A6H2DJG8_9SPHN|nr:nuclear transport factor 2 family protein [Parasphingorhabdus halotolerans]QJB68822.1 SnoaL-like domain-containing protein [Parasphingorhabdus halotolerans]